MDKIAVLIPCYNESKTVEKVVTDFRRVLPDATVYVYDNNSTEGTAELAARAGASYVSPFLGRLDDISMPGIDLIETIAEMFRVAGITTEIIAASVRNPIHVIDCALAGADIATVPYSVIEQMTKHPLTDQGIAKFQADYKAVFGE